MPPKQKLPVKSSTSKTLITTGTKEVQVSSRKKRDGPAPERPTTTKAMILRNGKHGARGTGELMAVSKLTGREKLDLLAEDLIEQSKKAVTAPFRMDAAQRIAESLMTQYIDDITNLQDCELFSSIIDQEIKARAPKQDDQSSEAARNPSFIGSTVSARIHNAYLLASGWRFVCDALIGLETEGVRDDNVSNMLKNNEDIRSLYMAAFRVVTELVELAQNKFALLATTTAHYAVYFRKTKGEDGEETLQFDWEALRQAGRSFLDSIIIELAFPRAPYPNGVLYEILKDACDEAPREAKRFPQALWDAIGDFSVAVSLQQLLEKPLIGPLGEEINKLSYEMPQAYSKWLDAQVYSRIASERYASFKDLIFPLSRTKDKNVLETMWKYVNLNYKSVCQLDIDALWGLEAKLLRPTPHWRSVRVRLNPDSYDEPGAAKGGKKPVLAITDGDDTDDGMPGLQDVSDSSDDNFSEDEMDEDSESEEETDDDESGYDTDQEDEMREMIREAMDAAHASGWQDPTDNQAFTQEDRKGNPFLKLLGSLKGRMFSSSSKLKASTKSGVKVDVSKLPKAPKPAKPPAPAPPKSTKTTIESDDDEDDTTAAKKKKKKPKKKKKKTGAASADANADEPEPLLELVEPKESEPVPAAAPAAAPVVQSKKTPAKTPAPKATGPTGLAATLPFGMSTTSLASDIHVQSGHSYIQQTTEEKPKIKSRPGHASFFSSITSGVFAKFSGRGKKDKKPEAQGVRRNHFSHLSRKSRGHMHQLLNTSEDETRGMTGMKWDVFAGLMREMGFTMDVSTAGSSVRFDPPDPDVRAISFHKPHPDSNIDRIKLKEWSKKLQNYYGWKPEDVMI